MMHCHKNVLCNKLLCLTEIYTLYDLDKHIGMTNVKLKVITKLTRTRHLSLLCARLIQLVSSYPISLRSILITSSSQLHVGIQICYFLPVLPSKHTIHFFFSST
jgi:hypothetical protein